MYDLVISVANGQLDKQAIAAQLQCCARDLRRKLGKTVTCSMLDGDTE